MDHDEPDEDAHTGSARASDHPERHEHGPTMGCDHVGMVPLAAARPFPATARSVAAARAWACEQATCRGWKSANEVIELLVSEIAANAIRHSRTRQFILRMRVIDDAGALEIAVYDSATTLPQPRQADQWDEDGRGMALIEVLADSWDVTLLPDGKWVRFQLRRPAPR